jgi:hypothetical protein
MMLSPQTMEAIERHRDGQGVELFVKLHAEVRKGNGVQVVHDDVHGAFNVGQWIAATEQAGHGRSVLFEIQIPSTPPGLELAAHALEAARRMLAQGHYAEVVAKCRLVIEGFTSELGQSAALAAATSKTPKHSRSLEERELVMRQAAMDFASLAHHPTNVSHQELFDRNAAQLMLSTAASLFSSATARHAAGQRMP